MARAIGQRDNKNLSNLERLAPTGVYEPQEETFDDLGGAVWIPDLAFPYKKDDGSINADACFTGKELQAIARGIIEPRVTDDEVRPPLSRAILEQMQRMEHNWQRVAADTGLSIPRLKRIVAIGGWGTGSAEAMKEAFFELLGIGEWYGDKERLMAIYSPEIVKKPPTTTDRDQIENGAK